MEFALSQDQRLLQESLARVLRQEASLDHVRRIAAGEADQSRALENAFCDFGLPALMVSVSAGGLGLGALEACLVQETLGHFAAPSRFLADAVAARLLAGHPDVCGAIASGDAVFGLAVTELISRRDGAGISAGSGRLTGKTLLVSSADAATHLLVGDEQGALHVAAARSAVLAPMQTIDRTRTFHSAAFDAAPVEISITPGDDFLAFCRLLVAADTLGAAQAMLDRSLDYAKQRQQFGRVIGAFQAVKHMCAEMAAKLEPGRALVWHAAHALDTGDSEGPLMANLAGSYLAEVGTFIARTSTEVHGGMGFTDLAGLHYWFKRIGLNRQLFGSPEQARQTAGALQGFAV